MSAANTSQVRRRVDLVGLVQGVGFRPHVARLAADLHISGWVRNDADGVHLEVQGSTGHVERFERLLVELAPPLARIDRTFHRDIPLAPAHESPAGARFEILASAHPVTAGLAAIPPDTATCAACLVEFHDPSNRRFRHPFISCTDCGPRWSIVTELPYDRPQTTMAGFEMCAACAGEYHDPRDRRYHAQPIACHDCGPTLRWFRTGAPSEIVDRVDEVLTATHADLANGHTLAIKGVGGFHLAVDATNTEAVARLRAAKGRPDKPFAVMTRDLETARRLADISDREAAALTDPARPIVLLRSLPNAMSASVTRSNPMVGVMLPYTPLHHLLFDPVPGRHTTVPDVLVLTSANLAGEPIVYDDDEATARLGTIADSFCTCDRAIATPCDDSVVRIIDDHESPIRRSRGYAPLPVELPFDVAPLLAIGGDLKNTICVASQRRALLSQHLGDMDHPGAQAALIRSAEALARLHGIEPTVVAADCHPGYRSRALATRMGLDLVSVGHHHAHHAALMAEHGLEREAQVIGFLFDGTGWGDDNTLWGGEVLVGGYGQVERRAHLEPVPLPGGDAAVRNPWRMAMAYLATAGVEASGLAPTLHSGAIERGIVDHQIATGLNSPPTTSMGRLFDAVASLLGIRHTVSYEAHAALELEAAATTAPRAAALGFGSNRRGVVSARPLISELVRQIRSGVDRGVLARGFHRAVAQMVIDLARHEASENPGLTTVALSGGVFQNDLLTRMTVAGLEGIGFEVLTHRRVPANDGGLSLGQAVIAGYQMSGAR